MTKVIFKPYVGEFYGTDKSLFKKRVLVLGESHYCDESIVNLEDVTNEVIKAYLNPNIKREDWMRTYRKFERSMVNKETDYEDSNLIWESVVFYNYLQFPMDKPRQSGTNEQYKQSVDAFFSVLNKYKPDSVIVWGKRLWHHLPDDNWREGKAYLFDGYTVDNGCYIFQNNKPIEVIPIYHPSSAFSWDWWYKVIKPYIE